MTTTAIHIEGNLLSPEMTSLLGEGNLQGQGAEDFGLGRKRQLDDEIAAAWGDAKAYWLAFGRRSARDGTESATTITRDYWAGAAVGFVPPQR